MSSYLGSDVSDTLPSGWVKTHHRETNKCIYKNLETGKKQYRFPSSEASGMLQATKAVTPKQTQKRANSPKSALKANIAPKAILDREEPKGRLRGDQEADHHAQKHAPRNTDDLKDMHKVGLLVLISLWLSLRSRPRSFPLSRLYYISLSLPFFSISLLSLFSLCLISLFSLFSLFSIFFFPASPLLTIPTDLILAFILRICHAQAFGARRTYSAQTVEEIFKFFTGRSSALVVSSKPTLLLKSVVVAEIVRTSSGKAGGLSDLNASQVSLLVTNVISFLLTKEEPKTSRASTYKKQLLEDKKKLASGSAHTASNPANGTISSRLMKSLSEQSDPRYANRTNNFERNFFAHIVRSQPNSCLRNMPPRRNHTFTSYPGASLRAVSLLGRRFVERKIPRLLTNFMFHASPRQ